MGFVAVGDELCGWMWAFKVLGVYRHVYICMYYIEISGSMGSSEGLGTCRVSCVSVSSPCIEGLEPL